MTAAMTQADADRILRNPQMFGPSDLDAAHEARMDAQRNADRTADDVREAWEDWLAAERIAHDRDDVPDDSDRYFEGAMAATAIIASAALTLVCAVIAYSLWVLA